MKKSIRKFIIIFCILVIALIGYGVYVFTSWYRLPENLPLEVKRNVSSSYSEESPDVKPGNYYLIMTYDIGFGAYRNDFGFFLEGGKSFRARNEESVIAAVCAMGEIINNTGPDFVLLQEVDMDGTRSYHVDELEVMNRFIRGYHYVYAQNYDSPYLFFPPWQPYGANESGMVTYSRAEITSAMRRSLPIAEDLNQYTDLDRCYSVSRIPVETEDGESKTLCIYNVHLSSRGSNREVRKRQLAMLYQDISADYRRGDYVICGGNFAQDLKGSATEAVHEWAEPFDRESLPEGFALAYDKAGDLENVLQDTARSAAAPYVEGKVDTVTLDGFIVSDNITVNFYHHMEWKYEFSYHEPAIMQFKLE